MVWSSKSAARDEWPNIATVQPFRRLYTEDDRSVCPKNAGNPALRGAPGLVVVEHEKKWWAV